MTYNQILRSCAETYIARIKASDGPLPLPEDMEGDLLANIQIEVDDVNESLPKGVRKMKRPEHLENITIATLINEFYHVKRIVWGKSDGENDGLLSIYQEDGENKGIYVSSETTFAKIARQFHHNISDHDVDTVYAILKELAEITPATKDPDLIAVNNGIFNYQTKELLEFSPDYVFIAKSNVNYNPKATNVIIHNDEDNTYWDVESWMADLSDDPEIVNLLWQVVGAVLRPHVRWDKAACFYSESGSNGKGTLCALMRNLCGSKRVASISFADFEKDFMLEPLTRASAIIVDENDTNCYIKSAGNIKSVITGDTFQLNCKYKAPITFGFSGLMVQCINNLLKFADKSESHYRRFLMIPFTKCFTGQERKYIKADYLKRSEVLEYVVYRVLNMSYDHHAWEDGKLPQACIDLWDEYKEYNDPVRQFLNEMLPELVWDLIPWNFLYDLYKAWFKRNNPSGQVQSKNSFSKDVKHILLKNSEWKVIERNDSPQRVGNRMDKTELLIYEYNLTDWMDPVYKGPDINKICQPVLKNTYRGLLRVGIATTDDEE